jgi:hypothetical protein
MRWVRRNLLIVLGNIGHNNDHRVTQCINTYLHSEHAELRAHAVWAAARLGLTSLLDTSDNHEMVQFELAHLPALRDNI